MKNLVKKSVILLNQNLARCQSFFHFFHFLIKKISAKFHSFLVFSFYFLSPGYDLTIFKYFSFLSLGSIRHGGWEGRGNYSV